MCSCFTFVCSSLKWKYVPGLASVKTISLFRGSLISCWQKRAEPFPPCSGYITAILWRWLSPHVSQSPFWQAVVVCSLWTEQSRPFMTWSVSIQWCRLPSSCLVNLVRGILLQPLISASHTPLYLTAAVLPWVSVSVFGGVKKEVNSRGQKRMIALIGWCRGREKRLSEAYDSLCVLHLNCPHHNNSPLQWLARFLGACLCASPSHSILLHHWCE